MRMSAPAELVDLKKYFHILLSLAHAPFHSHGGLTKAVRPLKIHLQPIIERKAPDENFAPRRPSGPRLHLRGAAQKTAGLGLQ